MLHRLRALKRRFRLWQARMGQKLLRLLPVADEAAGLYFLLLVLSLIVFFQAMLLILTNPPRLG